MAHLFILLVPVPPPALLLNHFFWNSSKRKILQPLPFASPAVCVISLLEHPHASVPSWNWWLLLSVLFPSTTVVLISHCCCWTPWLCHSNLCSLIYLDWSRMLMMPYPLWCNKYLLLIQHCKNKKKKKKSPPFLPPPSPRPLKQSQAARAVCCLG